MQLNDANLATFFTGLKTNFNKALQNAQTEYKNISMIVPSTTMMENYAWLTDVPEMREWIGSRIINGLGSQRVQIINRTFESTIGVPREAIEDDQYGIYGPIVAQMTTRAAMHPDEMIFQLLGEGFVTPCYDGQNFFDPEHPNGYILGGNQAPIVASNVFGSGKSAPWFLLDCSQPVKPMVFQERRAIALTQKTQKQDDNVFFDNQYLYGIDARYNVGFGLWQLAFACTDPLTPYNYGVMRAKMMSQVSATGRPLGVKPTHLVTVPGNDQVARRILRSETIEATTNEWKDSAALIVTQFLLGASNATPAWTSISDYLTGNSTFASGVTTTANGLPPTVAGGAS